MIPATGVIAVGPVAAFYLMASVAVLATNGVGWRFFGKRLAVSVAFDLAAVFLAAEIAWVVLAVYVARPWVWTVTVAVDVIMLLMASEVARGLREMWLRLLMLLLFCDLVLQLWLWSAYAAQGVDWSYWPPAFLKYDARMFRTYLTYVHTSNAVAAAEMLLIAWPGSLRIVLAARDRVRDVGRRRPARNRPA